MNGKKMVVLGTGAIGSSVAADLTKAGYDVIMVDQWPAHVEAMRANGLRVAIRGQDEFTVKVRAYHLCDLASLKPKFDIVFLVCKSYDSRWMATLVEPYLKPDGVVVPTQNSLNDEWVAPVVGKDRDVGCVVELSGEVFDPGVLKRNTNNATTSFVLGELDGKITPRVEELADIMSAVGKTKVTSDIWSAKWTKLMMSSMSMAVAASAGISGRRLAETKYLNFSLKLGNETCRVAAAHGYTIQPIFGLSQEDIGEERDQALKTLFMKLRKDVGETKSCVLQDLLKGRRSEAPGELNGLVVRKGKEVGVPTPCNEAVVSVVRDIEEGRLKPDFSNLERFDKFIS